MTIKPDKHLQVGDWQYLPEQDKLVQFAADGKIALTAELDNLSQKVANYFIVNAGRLITKDELLADVWGIRDVSDGRVTRVIRVLRVALGDDSREPTYIETIPKRGYRFVASVTEVVSLRPEPLESDVYNDESPIKKSTKFNNWVVAMLLVVLVVNGFWFFWQEDAPLTEDTNVSLLRYKPITSIDGLEFYHHVSADERFVVYSYASPENENVTVLKLEDLREHKRIQLTEESYSSFGAVFSPDTSQIAYHRYYPNGKCSIRLVQFDQSTFRVHHDRELRSCTENSPSSRLAWSPDGKFIVYPTMSVNRQMVLMMIPANGGPPEQLTTPPPSSFGDYAARFSFKGDKLAFLRATSSHAQLWLLDIVSRELKLLVNLASTLPGNVGWSADDQFVIYPSSPSVIDRVNIETGVSSVVAFTDLAAQEIQTLPNGQVYSTVGNFAHINIRNVSNPLKSPVEESSVVFSSNRNESHADANPIVGGPTAVVSRRSGLPQVWLFYPDGEQRQLTFFDSSMRIRSLTFAPNGKDLLLQLQNELWLLSDTGELTQVPHSKDVIVTAPAWGRNGKYVYYAETINGRWQIARYNVATNQIAQSPFAFDQELYIESYDGKYSFWRDAVNKKFYVKWFNSGVTEEVPTSVSDNQLWLRFQLSETGIYFTYLLDDIYYKLNFYEFKTKSVVSVLEDQVLTHNRFSVSADEKSIFILESVRGDLDIATLKLP